LPHKESEASIFGFKTENFGAEIFVPIWEHHRQKTNENESIEDPKVSAESWEMTFKIEETPEKLESCADFSDDDEEPVTETAEIRVSITEDEENDKFVDFTRLSGD